MALAAQLLAGCASSGDTAPDDRAALVPAVLVARYAGTLPCADCPGIRTILGLYSETQYGLPSAFELKETFLDTKDGDRTFSRTGRWTILYGSPDDPDATLYQLDSDRPDRSRSFLRRGDHELVLLGRTRREPIASSRSTLTRVDEDAVDPVVVTGEDVGHPVHLIEGQWLVVRLASNPTTGFRWSLAGTPEGLALRGEPTYVPDPSRPPIGGGGHEVCQLAAVRSGRHTLRFEYRRPWEREATAARVAAFVVTITK